MGGKWDSEPFGSDHRKCYQTNTAKSLLARVGKKRKIDGISVLENVNTEAAELLDDLRSTRSSILPTDMKMCVICQTDKTDPKNRRKTEKLTICEPMQAAKKLLEAANSRGDQRLLTTLHDQDPIAIELCYHRTCYRSYTNMKGISNVSKNQECRLESLYDEAFQGLKSEIKSKSFERFEVLSMSELQQRHLELLSQHSIENPVYRSEKIKTRMQKAYLGRIKFCHPRYPSASEDCPLWRGWKRPNRWIRSKR